MASVDASNSCIPPSHPLYASVPPLPSTTRGERCILDGKCGRHNYDRSVLLYSNGKSVVIREMDAEVSSSVDRKNKVLIYRGHTATVTAAKFSPSGCFVASGDARGKLRVWSYDNEEHLCKLDIAALTGPIRDLSWDMDSKRICIVGERNDTSSPCTRVIQWDTGVTCGELSQHTRGRASSCDFKPNRPMRIVTGGMDDSRVYFNSGPPFTRVVDGVLTDDAHSKAVNCIKYTSDGSKIVSIGADKAIVLYDGKTMKLLDKLENVHKGNIYACAWNGSDKFILTCSADGTCKLISAEPLEVVHTWDVAEFMSGHQSDSVPIGAMLVGCTFVKDDIPVTVAINGDLTFLPKPPMLDCGIDNFKKFTGHGSPIIGMAMDPSRGVFYTADSDGALCEFSTETLTPTKRFSQPGSTDLLHKMHGDATISCLTTVAGGNVLTGGWDDTICKVSSEGNVLENAMALTAQPNAIASGTLLAVVVTVEGLVLIENASNMSAVLVFDYIPKSVCVSADDSTVYVGGEDCNIHVYKVLDEFKLEESHIIEGAHFKEIHALRLSHDNTKLASADVRDICVWDLANNYEPIVNKSKWCFHTQRIICLAWSPDDSLLASGGADDSIYLWSLNKKMRRLHYPHSHRGGVTGIEFVNGKKMMLVSVGADSCVNQWD
eukprot:CAMPEP_0178896732 /NCGR_PEP_ID=MMETSP0786-20121207/1346_1 /TAXON_ID=186022 /ORGANISM="Thalassionema frauenfeldii, Strain CCMP 1798" /LENGTH=660 /DNA_ID=CAMNT_0020567187 /DNA_START=52 /DNA_END=2031 /DNA_ORIENTATION=+